MTKISNLMNQRYLVKGNYFCRKFNQLRICVSENQISKTLSHEVSSQL